LFTYIVITNAHVVDNIPSYQISTFDRRIYAARRLQNPQITNRDLAVLIFTSSIEYQPAKIGNSQQLKSGDPVYAGGFPAQACTMLSPNTAEKNRIFPCIYNFNLSEGTIFQRLNKELAGGYQIGYTNNIQKGMSGGPLIDRYGNLVAINGVHSSPLWEGGWTYADGSPVAEPLQSTLDRYSWGIPIERIPPNF
jgi:S1-C subfamily serine protease